MSREKCPSPKEDCPYKHPFMDEHHYYWPKSEYRGRMESRFREHFVELMCRCVHDEQHRLPPPDKPSPEEMRQFLIERGQLNVESGV